MNHMQPAMNQCGSDRAAAAPDAPGGLGPELQARIDGIVARYPVKRSAVLMILHALQEEFGYITPAHVEWTAARLELNPIQVWELVTFHPMFRTAPAGRLHVRVCRSLPCALRGSMQLYRELATRLGLDPEAPGPQTTADGTVTLELVECLAACHCAPVVQVNSQLIGRADPDAVRAVLDAAATSPREPHA